jgi:hypothetical protein
MSRIALPLPARIGSSTIGIAPRVRAAGVSLNGRVSG